MRLDLAFFLAMRYGDTLSRVMNVDSDEALLLGVLGLVLIVAGAADLLKVSAAIGAFLVGIALSGPVAERARHQIEPLRDLFAAVFFVLFGLQLVFGLLSAAKYLGPDPLLYILPFDVTKVIHTNLLIVWVLTGFMGATYWMVPDESRSELHSTKLAYIQLGLWVVMGVSAIIGYLFRFGTGNKLLEPQSAAAGGSLGPQLDATGTIQPMEGVFVVEMTDPAESTPTPGSAVGGNNPANTFRDVQLTFTAFAQVRPFDATPDDPWCASNSLSTSASVTSLRAHVTLRNVPR